MTALAVATAAFLLTHLVTSTPLRPRLVAALGEWPYRGAYSAIAFATLLWMIWAYAHSAPQPLWPGLRSLPLFVMPLAFVLIVCGYWRNPTMVGADKLLASDDPARCMIRITRHPIMWGLMLWALAHIAARGDSASLVFFGGFLLLAAFGTLAMDRRKRADPNWARFAALTSHVPFVAIAQRRNRLVWREPRRSPPIIGPGGFLVVLPLDPLALAPRPHQRS